MIVDDTDMPKTGRKGEMLGRVLSHVDNRGSILIPIPPITEQERIVSILDRFEALSTDLPAVSPPKSKPVSSSMNTTATLCSHSHGNPLIPKKWRYFRNIIQKIGDNFGI